MTIWTKNIGVQPDGSILLADGSIMSSIERANLLTQVSALPIIPQLQTIRDAVSDAIVTIISAETGSGKTTQVPKALRRLGGRYSNIAVAEPRVIATINAATRVSRELVAQTGDPNFALGHRVGYRTGKGSESMPGTELLFVTDGLQLLRQFVSGRTPDILIADEVHNFSVSTEFLLAQSKRQMLETNNKFKLVLMSATLDQQLVRDFFSDVTKDIPVFNIPGRTYPVDKFFKIDTEFLPSILELAQRQPGKTGEEEFKNILVFVEGKKKIETTIKYLRDRLYNYEILPLHSELPISEQRLVMSKGNKPRIIVATNIAQESITIPYINAVVDNGFGKVLRVNERGIPELRKEHISQADSEQRAGRAGRVMIGEYVRANSKRLNKLKMFPDAEIGNITIEKFILGALAIGFNPIKELEILKNKDKKPFVHAPDPELLQMSYDNLIKLGAITRDHKVTVLGRRLLTLPLEPHIGKMLLEGIKRGCGSNMVDICAMINHNGFFAKSELWKKFVPGRFKNESDLIAQRELFNLITTREPLDSEMLHNLHHYGLDKGQIEEYKRISNSTKEKMLFEVIDFTTIGVKSKAVNEILKTRETLTDRLNSAGEILEIGEDLAEVCKSILAGMLNNLYTWNKKAKKFKHHNKGEFQKPLTSVLNPSNKYFYAGSPFIVGGDEEDSDLYLLSFITRVEPEWIEEVAKPFLHEEFSHVEFTKKKVGLTKRGSDKFEPSVRAKKVTKLSGLQISSNVGEVPKEKVKSVLFYTWLPEFLIKENQLIKKFIRSHNKGKFNTEKFQELLKIICKKLYGSYDVNKFQKHKDSFMHDTQILYYFEESDNPAIREFLTNPYKETYEQKSQSIYKDIIAEENEGEEIEEAAKIKAELERQTEEARRKISQEKREARVDRRKEEKDEIVRNAIEKKEERRKKQRRKRDDSKILTKKEDRIKIPRKKKKMVEKLSDPLNCPKPKISEVQAKKLEKPNTEKGGKTQIQRIDKQKDLKMNKSQTKSSNSPQKEFKKESEYQKQKGKAPKVKPLTQSAHEREKKKNQRILKVFRGELFKVAEGIKKDQLKKDFGKVETYLKETKWYQFSVTKISNMMLRLKFKIEAQLPKTEKVLDLAQ